MFFLRKYLLTILCACAIFVLSVVDFSSANAVAPFPNFDKAVHFAMYFVLGALFCYEAKPRMLQNWILTAILPIIYGGVIELLQEYFFPPRTGEWSDFFSDMVGVLIGMLLCRLVFHKKWT